MRTTPFPSIPWICDGSMTVCRRGDGKMNISALACGSRCRQKAGKRGLPSRGRGDSPHDRSQTTRPTGMDTEPIRPEAGDHRANDPLHRGGGASGTSPTEEAVGNGRCSCRIDKSHLRYVQNRNLIVSQILQAVKTAKRKKRPCRPSVGKRPDGGGDTIFRSRSSDRGLPTAVF